MKKVVVVGMGFGGLRVASALSRSGLQKHDLDVLVLDRRNYHLFQPLLYQVATAMLEEEAVAYSSRAILRRMNGVRFRMTTVQSVDFAAKRVLTSDGAVPYDYLVLAAGSVTNFFGNANLEKNAFDLKKLDDAVALRNHILSAYERAAKESDSRVREALMTFVVVGAGPTGVEFAGSLSELTHHVLTQDFPELHPERSKIIMLEAAHQVLPHLPEELGEYTRAKLEKMGVEVRLGCAVTDATPEKVTLADGTEIRSHTLFWAAGVKAAPLAEAIPVTKSRGGRVPVNADWSLPEYSDVFVIGDMASYEYGGAVLPCVAPVAMQGGEYVAQTILARERGKTLAPFRYVDKGSMAVIGRHAAVAQAKGIRLKGPLAWAAWLGLHLMYLVGFRNRVVTLLNWAYEYFRYNRQVRLITRDAEVATAANADGIMGGEEKRSEAISLRGESDYDVSTHVVALTRNSSAKIGKSKPLMN
jgi:NADH:ubiquinone reductase (H+-translocating)